MTLTVGAGDEQVLLAGLAFKLSPVGWAALASPHTVLEKMLIFPIGVLDVRGHFGASWQVCLFCLQQMWQKRSEKPRIVTPTSVKLAGLLYKAASAHNQNNSVLSQIGSLCLASVDVASEPPIFRGVTCLCVCVCVCCESPARRRDRFMKVIKALESEIAQIRCYVPFFPPQFHYKGNTDGPSPEWAKVCRQSQARRCQMAVIMLRTNRNPPRVASVFM